MVRRIGILFSLCLFASVGSVSTHAATSQTGRADVPLVFTSVSAGLNETCGLETGGIGLCWGVDNVGQSEAPADTFTQIEAGHNWGCGILTDQSIACWGKYFPKFPTNTYTDINGICAITTAGMAICPGSGTPQFPAGDYTQVASRPDGGFACALKTSGSIICRAPHFTPVDPTGTFTSLTAGGGQNLGTGDIGCGITTSAGISCWPEEATGSTGKVLTEIPTGTFSQVSMGADGACAVRTTGAVVCWDAFGDHKTLPGTYTAFSAGQDDIAVEHDCGLHTDGSIQCFGAQDYGQSTTPTDTFTQVSAGGEPPNSFTTGIACGLHTDGSVVCLGDYNKVPNGTFTSISAGWLFACGVETSESVSCFGRNINKDLNAPAGSFTQVSAGFEFACGVTTIGSAKCWGNTTSKETKAPAADTFSQVSAGKGFACGVETNAAIVCWGTSANGVRKVPAGTYTEVSAGWQMACGLTTAQAITCWGKPGHGATKAPSGQFTSVSAGQFFACAVRVAGTGVCWGLNKGGEKTVPHGVITGGISAGAAFVPEVEHGGWKTPAGFACGVRNGGLSCWGALSAYNP